MPKTKGIQTILGQEGSDFGAVAGSLFARKDKESKRKAKEAVAWEAFFQFLKGRKQNLRTNLDKKLSNLQSTFEPFVKGYEEVYRNEILPIFERDRKWKRNPNFFYQEAETEIAGPDIGLDLKGLTKDDLDLTGKEALEKLTRALADDKERYHLEQMDNPLTQFRSAPEFTKVMRDDYAARVNKEIEDPANYRLTANFLKRIDKEFGSREEHRANLQAGVDRAWTNRHIFEEDIKALRNVPGVTVGDTSYLDDVVFGKAKPLEFDQRAKDIVTVANDIEESLAGNEDGTLTGFHSKFYVFDGKTLALPTDTDGEIIPPTEGPYRPFKSEEWGRDDPFTITSGSGIDIDSFTVVEIDGKNKYGTYKFKEIDLKGLNFADEVAPTVVTIMTDMKERQQAAARALMKQDGNISMSEAFSKAGVMTQPQLLRASFDLLAYQGQLRINPDKDSFTLIRLTEDRSKTRQLPKEYWWLNDLNNQVFEQKVEQGAGGLELVDIALEQEESDINEILLNSINDPDMSEEDREELQIRLDTINEAKRVNSGKERVAKNPASFAAEVLKFIIAPEIFGASDLVGQPIKFKRGDKKEGVSEDIVYDLGALKQSDKESLYNEYQNIWKRRNAEIEALIYPQEASIPSSLTPVVTPDLITPPKEQIDETDSKSPLDLGFTLGATPKGERTIERIKEIPTRMDERNALQRLTNYSKGINYREEQIKDALITLGLDQELSRQEVKEALISQNIL